MTSAISSRSLFKVRHTTTYRYSTMVTASQSIVHLTPRPTGSQHIRESHLSSDPNPTDRSEHLDVFGNAATYLAIEHPHDTWKLTAESVVEIEPPPVPPDDVVWHDAALSYQDPSVIEMTLASPHVPVDDVLARFARQSFPPSGLLVEGVRALIYRIFSEFVFDPAATEVSTAVHSVLDDRRGVCQDFAHLSIACLRSVGLAARYVSGYLETDPAPGMTKLIGSDASHAWISVFVPGFGWLDADPTNGILPFGRHITVAWGRDYSDVAPSRGIVFGPPSTQQLDVAVDVIRLYEQT